MSKKIELDFWFEISSPYSYISAMRIESCVKEIDLEINWKPFLLGPIFASYGWNTSPFNIFKEKGDYMWEDVRRRCERLDIPFQKPSNFPINSVYASRAIISELTNNKSDGVKLCKKLFQEYFVRDKNIGDGNVLQKILSETKHSKSLENFSSEKIKMKLRFNTETAQELKVFGAPTFIANGNHFWGDDRIDDLIWFLKSCKT